MVSVFETDQQIIMCDRLSVLNWNALRGRTLISPIKQPYNGPSDARNFDMFNPDSFDPCDEGSGWDIDF